MKIGLQARQLFANRKDLQTRSRKATWIVFRQSRVIVQKRPRLGLDERDLLLLCDNAEQLDLRMVLFVLAQGYPAQGILGHAGMPKLNQPLLEILLVGRSIVERVELIPVMAKGKPSRQQNCDADQHKQEFQQAFHRMAITFVERT